MDMLAVFLENGSVIHGVSDIYPQSYVFPTSIADTPDPSPGNVNQPSGYDPISSVEDKDIPISAHDTISSASQDNLALEAVRKVRSSPEQCNIPGGFRTAGREQSWKNRVIPIFLLPHSGITTGSLVH